MSGFSADWLRLREPLDAAARAEHGIDAALAGEHGSARSIVDLGCGTGANLRFLAPRLGGRQDWLLLDDDRRLLDAATAVSADWARAQGARWERSGSGFFRIRAADFDCRVRTRHTDLSRGLGELALEDACLVTASALLDLVGDSWLEALASRCGAAGASVLFALSYDGRVRLAPADGDDAWIIDLVNRDQRRDKGFGPALGPAAGDAAARIFAATGFDLERKPSDWRIAPEQRREQHALLAAWHDAACRAAPGETIRVGAWRKRRALLIDEGRSRLRVGHVDLLGLARA